MDPTQRSLLIAEVKILDAKIQEFNSRQLETWQFDNPYGEVIQALWEQACNVLKNGRTYILSLLEKEASK